MTMPAPKETAQAALAYVLLTIYVVTVGYLIYAVVACARASGCTAVTTSEGMLYVVTTLGGLVSALVVASLAVSVPSETLSIAGLDTTNNATLTWLYVGAWALAGIAALIVGVMLYPDKSQTVEDIGTAWLGLAIMGVYAYFGIAPKR
jgi:hypothetical protein